VARHPEWFAALALLVIALVLFAPVVAQPSGLVYPPRGDFTDLTITHWPNIEFAVSSFRVNGRLPLWRPTIMSGTPFAANPLSGLHYFPHAIFFILTLAIGFNVLFIAHAWLTGCGAYMLLRTWQVGWAAAFIGALTWMATPKLFAHLGAGHVSLVESIAWLPWAMLAAHRLMERRRTMDAVWLGAVWALQFLADPRISFYSVALTAGYLVFRLGASYIDHRNTLKSAIEGSWKALLSVGTFAVLGAMLWLPFWEFVSQSNRGTLTLAEAGEWSLPLDHLVGLLIADWGGIHEWMVYVGVLPLLLAIAGCRKQGAGNRQRNLIASCFLPLALVIAALFALGTNGPLFPLLFRIVPGLTLLRVPPRVWFIVAFAVACLCAFGVEVMTRDAQGTRKPYGRVTLAGVALALFALLFGLGGFLMLQSNAQASLARAAMLHMALVVPASFAVVLLRAHGRIGVRGFAVATSAVIAATLLPIDWSLYRVVPEAQAFSDHADIAEWLAAQGQPGTFRVYSPSYSLPQHVVQRAGLELADGVDPMQLASYAQLMQSATGARASGYSVTIPSFPPDSDVRTALRDVMPDVRLLGKLNVRYVVAEFPMKVEGLIERAQFGPTFVYENQWAMPRAFVENGTPAHIVVYTPDRVVVEADGPGTLTLSQAYYPGWRVTVDGHRRDLTGLENLSGLSAGLEAGHHVVEFVFDPWTVKVGVITSVIGWSSLVVGSLVLRLRSFVLRQKG
jgi:hypothetical protein